MRHVAESRRRWKGGTESIGEWAPEGEQNFQYVSRRRDSVIKISIYLYALSGYVGTKPGGTAGV